LLHDLLLERIALDKVKRGWARESGFGPRSYFDLVEGQNLSVELWLDSLDPRAELPSDPVEPSRALAKLGSNRLVAISGSQYTSNATQTSSWLGGTSNQSPRGFLKELGDKFEFYC
jgi:hypothetical protein